METATCDISQNIVEINNPLVFTVKMGGFRTTDEIMRKWNFSFDPWITQANFPLAPNENQWEDEIEIVDPGRYFSEEEGLRALKEKGLERPRYEHGIRFLEQHGKTTISEKKPFVVFLHEAWQDPWRRRRIMYLRRYAEYQGFHLISPEIGFRDGYVIAGVRPRK